jgi:hypothetical protein
MRMTTTGVFRLLASSSILGQISGISSDCPGGINMKVYVILSAYYIVHIPCFSLTPAKGWITALLQQVSSIPAEDGIFDQYPASSIATSAA